MNEKCVNAQRLQQLFAQGHFWEAGFLIVIGQLAITETGQLSFQGLSYVLALMYIEGNIYLVGVVKLFNC